MKKPIYLTLLLTMLLQLSHAQSFYELLSGTIDVVVASDGSGDYATVMEAINASGGGQVIFIKNGVYHEKIEILSTKFNLTLIGENVDSTILQYNDYSGSEKDYTGIISSEQGNKISTVNSHSFYNQSSNLTLMNLTIKNTAGDVGQAVALNLDKDRTRIVHCRIMGNQDTFLTRSGARHLIKDCFIEGDVDFIFGGGAVIFDSCVINSNRGNSHITAPATDKNWTFGYVFQNCQVTANRGVTNVFFARPWHNYPKVTFMYCYLGSHIAPAGWANPWNLEQDNCTFAEYENYGPGSDVSKRVDWSVQLNESIAAVYTKEFIFGKDVSDEVTSDWDPDICNDEIYKILRANTALLYDEKFNSACLDTIRYNNELVEGISTSKTGYSVLLPAGTTEVPVVTAVPDSPKATIDAIVQAESLPGTATIKVRSGNGVSLNYTVSFSVGEDPSAASVPRLDEQIRLLKNPVGPILEFYFENIESDIDFTLFNSAGQIVITDKIPGRQVSNIKSYTMDDFTDGIYYYRFFVDKEVLSGKVIKL